MAKNQLFLGIFAQKRKIQKQKPTQQSDRKMKYALRKKHISHVEKSKKKQELSFLVLGSYYISDISIYQNKYLSRRNKDAK